MGFIEQEAFLQESYSAVARASYHHNMVIAYLRIPMGSGHSAVPEFICSVNWEKRAVLFRGA